ncbi:FmdB family zinc ribbon protein [Mycolicibacterium goodii]|uniref:Zinc ribbon domain-containing protein n=1 Tax=Mycolicibacterium goodii TaxID=134601 RepID=A0ABS6HL98_MYCGD|nr:zinc ribbon domain-containing protein [Mycolicibacterium goodii]OKH66992.1 hypothetical protein EB74_02755 [Mycobacterium sp. SWH-M5]MBU8812566.1 zinc ribbon domain-containing protein [Mycolicibacterium goodii]MBU8818829.1 zinc ribbon domain-containing protein [Mycolicibacterium goodii]MBU8823467.1 zinc ribbon domain-containing protein [Mycolicibacterium goodii]MBU8830120.1 zinc ribbon domain-containing protein [Mycolicibacterium goodii]
MPTYTFRCSNCGPFDLTRAIAEHSSTPACPECQTPARRVFGSVPLTTFTAGHHRAFDAAAASAESPTVVKSIPAGADRPRAPRRNPGLQSLPRW